MNRKLLLVPFLSFLAACNAPAPAPVPAQSDVTTPDSTSAAAETSTTPAPAGDATAPAAAGNALPETIVIGAPYELRLDHVVTNTDGLVRRQVTYQFPDAEFNNTAANMEAAFRSAGFKPRPPWTEANGDIVLTFDKSKYGTAFAILKHASDKASTPRSLLVDFPPNK